jgi:hypothetical protein
MAAGAMFVAVLALVPMNMAMYHAVGMDMRVRMFSGRVVFMHRAIDPRFAGATAASRTHARSLQTQQS